MKVWQILYSFGTLIGLYLLYIILVAALSFAVYLLSFAVIALPTVTYIKWYIKEGRQEIKEKRSTNRAVEFTNKHLIRSVYEFSVSFVRSLVDNIKLVAILAVSIVLVRYTVPESLDAIFEKISVYVVYFSTLVILRAFIYVRFHVKTPSYWQALSTAFK